MSTIQDDLLELPLIGEAFIHALDFVWSLESGDFVKEDSQWVFRPCNFVTISIHPNAKNITVSLRGNPHEFAEFPHLQLNSGMAGYSRFKMEEIGQLDAVLCHIRRAHELYVRGRTRTQKSLKLVES